MLNKYFLIALISLMLQSCGSGSSSSDDGEVITEYQFELLAYLKNECGQTTAFNQFEIHLQDDNWQLIERYFPDDKGLISFITDQKKINYTLVAKFQQGDSEEGLDIVSYNQANTTNPTNYFATYDNSLDNSNCECITQDVELEHRIFSTIETVSASFDYDTWLSIDSQHSYFNDVKVCREIGNTWPVESIAIKGRDTNNNSIGVASLLTNFSSNEDKLWRVAAIESAEIVYLPQEHGSFEMTQLFSDGEHFSTASNEQDEKIAIFNSHPYISEAVYYTKSYHLFEDINTIFGQSTFSSYHQIKSTLYDEVFEVSATSVEPNIDNTSFSDLGADGSYDYSQVSGFVLVKFIFEYEVESLNINADIPTTWTMYGPIGGILASTVQLAGYENNITPDTDIKRTDIKIIKSASSNNYEDYIRYYQSDLETGFSDDLRYFQLKLIL